MTSSAAPPSIPSLSPFMSRALELSASVRGATSPNPNVGAVLVRDGRIVGEGATQPPGGLHAEAVALQQAGEQARGATLYCTLEPHPFHGRQPPCTDALIAAGVAEAHVALIDPDAHCRGRGVAQLRAAGIPVTLGEGELQARRLLDGYIKHRLTGLPLVTAKFAASLDGKIAARSGDSRWISGESTREYTHRQRALADAILVGGHTVVVDDPQLTARPGGSMEGVRQPMRVVADSSGRVTQQAKILHVPGKVLIATTDNSPRSWRAMMTLEGAEVIVLPSRMVHVDFEELLVALGERGIVNLLVEGGGRVIGSLFDLELVDRVQAIIAPIIVGGADAPTAVQGDGSEQMADATRLANVTVQQIAGDIIVEGDVPGRAPEDWEIEPAVPL